MNVVHVVAEYWPFARTGGLAEAVRGIATHQHRRGTSTAVFMPLYRIARERTPALEPACEDVVVPLHGQDHVCRILKKVDPPAGSSVYFVDYPPAFDRKGIYGEGGGDYPDNPSRFAVFSRAALEALPKLFPDGPIVLHPHDWHTAASVIYLRLVYAGNPYYDAVATVLTVHNAGYQGLYGRDSLAGLGLPPEAFRWDRMEYYDQVNWLKGGLALADWVTTVSPTHAYELRTVPGGFGLHDVFIGLGDRLVGILNGIDQEIWDPATDVELEEDYSVDDLSGKRACKRKLQELAGLPMDEEIPLIAMTARLAKQKGFDLILGDGLLQRITEAQFLFLGEGDLGYQRGLEAVAAQIPHRVAAFFEFTEQKEHWLLGGADMLLMPSQYEPCGLTQMRAQRYGALPVVRRVGGLADTVEDQVTGFVFDDFTPAALEVALRRGITAWEDRESWEEHMREAMARDFGWERSADRYLELYDAAVQAHLTD